MRYLLLVSSVLCFVLAIACASLNNKINGSGCDERSPTSNGTEKCSVEAPKERAEPGVAHH